MYWVTTRILLYLPGLLSSFRRLLRLLPQQLYQPSLPSRSARIRPPFQSDTRSKLLFDCQSRFHHWRSRTSGHLLNEVRHDSPNSTTQSLPQDDRKIQSGTRAHRSDNSSVYSSAFLPKHYPSLHQRTQPLQLIRKCTGKETSRDRVSRMHKHC